METVIKFRPLAGLFCAAMVLLGACGSKEQPPAPTSPDEGVVPAPVFPPGSTLDLIQKSGKLRVGVAFNQPGFGVKPSTDAEPSGFDIEIAKLLARDIFGGALGDADNHIEYVEAVSTNRENFLRDNRVDMVIAAYPITAARKVQVDFAGPYYMSHGDVMVKKEAAGLQRISDMNGQAVCTRSNSLLITPLQSKAPQANITTADTYAQCVQRLKDGVVQGVVSDEVVLAGLVQSSDGAYRALGSNFSDDPYGIGVAKGNDALRTFLNDRLQAIEASGEWAKAYEGTLGRLGLPAPAPPAIDRYVDPARTTTTSVAPSSSTTAVPTSTAPSV